jgi:DNA replication protein DnaC
MSIVDTALHDSLRALKLSGMLHTLDARLAQARAGELGHLEFLQVLCHDEINRREATAAGRRLRRARFEQTATLEEFDFAASPSTACDAGSGCLLAASLDTGWGFLGLQRSVVVEQRAAYASP